MHAKKGEIYFKVLIKIMNKVYDDPKRQFDDYDKATVMIASQFTSTDKREQYSECVLQSRFLNVDDWAEITDRIRSRVCEDIF